MIFCWISFNIFTSGIFSLDLFTISMELQ